MCGVFNKAAAISTGFSTELYTGFEAPFVLGVQLKEHSKKPHLALTSGPATARCKRNCKNSRSTRKRLAGSYNLIITIRVLIKFYLLSCRFVD